MNFLIYVLLFLFYSLIAFCDNVIDNSTFVRTDCSVENINSTWKQVKIRINNDKEWNIESVFIQTRLFFNEIVLLFDCNCSYFHYSYFYSFILFILIFSYN